MERHLSPKLHVKLHNGGVTNCSITSDGTRALTVGLDGKARLWSLETGAEICIPLSMGLHEFQTCALSHDTTWAATTGTDGVVRIWNTTDGSNSCVLRASDDAKCTDCDIVPMGRFVYAAFQAKTIWAQRPGMIIRYSLDAEMKQVIEQRSTTTHGPPRKIAVSHNGNMILYSTVDKGGKCVVYCPLRERSAMWECDDKGTPPDIGISAEGERVVIADSTTLRVFTLTASKAGLLLPQYNLVLGQEPVCAISLDASRVVARCSGYAGDEFRVWDAATGDIVAVLSGHTGSVTACAISLDGMRVLTCGREGSLVWDVDDVKGMKSAATCTEDKSHEPLHSTSTSFDSPSTAADQRARSIAVTLNIENTKVPPQRITSDIQGPLHEQELSIPRVPADSTASRQHQQSTPVPLPETLTKRPEATGDLANKPEFPVEDTTKWAIGIGHPAKTRGAKLSLERDNIRQELEQDHASPELPGQQTSYTDQSRAPSRLQNIIASSSTRIPAISQEKRTISRKALYEGFMSKICPITPGADDLFEKNLSGGGKANPLRQLPAKEEPVHLNERKETGRIDTMLLAKFERNEHHSGTTGSTNQTNHHAAVGTDSVSIPGCTPTKTVPCGEEADPQGTENTASDKQSGGGDCERPAKQPSLECETAVQTSRTGIEDNNATHCAAVGSITVPECTASSTPTPATPPPLCRPREQLLRDTEDIDTAVQVTACPIPDAAHTDDLTPRVDASMGGPTPDTARQWFRSRVSNDSDNGALTYVQGSEAMVDLLAKFGRQGAVTQDEIDEELEKAECNQTYVITEEAFVDATWRIMKLVRERQKPRLSSRFEHCFVEAARSPFGRIKARLAIRIILDLVNQGTGDVFGRQPKCELPLRPAVIEAHFASQNIALGDLMSKDSFLAMAKQIVYGKVGK